MSNRKTMSFLYVHTRTQTRTHIDGFFSLLLYRLSLSYIYPSISLVFVKESNKREKNYGQSCLTELYPHKEEEEEEEEKKKR